MPSPTLELAYVEIESDDLDRWASFATDVLGLAVERVGGPSGAVLLLRTDTKRYRIAVFAGRENKFVRTVYRTDGPAGLDCVAMGLDGAHVQYSRHDSCELPSGRRGEACIDFCDPGGQQLRVTWGAPEDSALPLAPPTGICYSSHRLGAMGHVVLLVPDLEESVDFYTRALGFSVTDYIGDGPSRLAFLRCNERHHTVALMAGETSYVDHLMLEVASVDDVARVYDIARRLPDVAASEMGRHSNDFALSFYIRTPMPGLEIEFGTGAIDVHEPWTTNWHAVGSLWGHGRLIDYGFQNPDRSQNSSQTVETIVGRPL